MPSNTQLRDLAYEICRPYAPPNVLNEIVLRFDTLQALHDDLADLAKTGDQRFVCLSAKLHDAIHGKEA